MVWVVGCFRGGCGVGREGEKGGVGESVIGQQLSYTSCPRARFLNLFISLNIIGWCSFFFLCV